MDAVGPLYATFYTILYKRLEHLWVLVFSGGPGTNLLNTPRGDASFGSSKVTHGLSTVQGVCAPNCCDKNQLYSAISL